MKWYLKYLKVVAFMVVTISIALIALGAILTSSWILLGSALGTISGLIIMVALMPLMFKGIDWLWDKWFKEEI